MSLKQIIRKQTILANSYNSELTIPGEPHIYSIKYSLGSRSQPIQFWKKENWKSILKSFFQSHLNIETPVVIIVRFYVTPPEHVKISKKALKSEKTVATRAHEVCDYLLAFLDLLHYILIATYRQIVNLQVDKFYSAEPRTVFKFMSYNDYEKHKDKDSTNTKSKRKRKKSSLGRVL